MPRKAINKKPFTSSEASEVNLRSAGALTRSVKKKMACLWSLHCVHEGKITPAGI